MNNNKKKLIWKFTENFCSAVEAVKVRTSHWLRKKLQNFLHIKICIKMHKILKLNNKNKQNWETKYNCKQDIHVANKYMKRCSTLCVIMDLHIKITTRYHHYAPIEMAIVRKSDNAKCWQEIKWIETPFYFCWGWTILQPFWMTV